MKHIRIGRRRVRSERPRIEELSPDPRDPDIVRAKALTRTVRCRKALRETPDLADERVGAVQHSLAPSYACPALGRQEVSP